MVVAHEARSRDHVGVDVAEQRLGAAPADLLERDVLLLEGLETRLPPGVRVRGRVRVRIRVRGRGRVRANHDLEQLLECARAVGAARRGDARRLHRLREGGQRRLGAQVPGTFDARREEGRKNLSRPAIPFEL